MRKEDEEKENKLYKYYTVIELQWIRVTPIFTFMDQARYIINLLKNRELKRPASKIYYFETQSEAQKYVQSQYKNITGYKLISVGIVEVYLTSEDKKQLYPTEISCNNRQKQDPAFDTFAQTVESEKKIGGEADTNEIIPSDEIISSEECKPEEKKFQAFTTEKKNDTPLLTKATKGTVLIYKNWLCHECGDGFAGLRTTQSNDTLFDDPVLCQPRFPSSYTNFFKRRPSNSSSKSSNADYPLEGLDSESKKQDLKIAKWQELKEQLKDYFSDYYRYKWLRLHFNRSHDDWAMEIVEELNKCDNLNQALNYLLDKRENFLKQSDINTEGSFSRHLDYAIQMCLEPQKDEENIPHYRDCDAPKLVRAIFG